MRARVYKIFLAVCLLTILITGVAWAADTAQTLDGKDYYVSVYKEYQGKPLDIDMQGVITAPIGSATIDVKLEGFAPEAKVCKMVFDIKVNLLNREQNTIKIVSYLEQEPHNLQIYHHMDNKWTKQTRENMQVLGVVPNAAEEKLKIIKSVEVIKNTPDNAELKVYFDFSQVNDLVEQTLANDKVNFKNQKEKDEAMQAYKSIVPYLNKMNFIEYVDKKNKILTAQFDLTPIIRDAVSTLLKSDKKTTDKERMEIEEFLNESQVIFTTKARIINKAVKIKIPKEAKRLAKDISVKPKTDDVDSRK